MSNSQAAIEALNKLLGETRAELERSTEERERLTLELYCKYLEARLARL
jgi:hypothetical protein